MYSTACTSVAAAASRVPGFFAQRRRRTAPHARDSVAHQAPQHERSATAAARADHTATLAVSSRRGVLGAGAACLAALVPGVNPAQAREVTIAIEDLRINLCANPVASGTPGTGTFKAKCYEITGTAVNPNKLPLNNADVYGIVLDAANDPVLRSGRVGAIDSVPPGRSPFRLEITVAASQLLPLRMKNFRGVGFLGTVNRPGNPYDMDYESGLFPSGSVTKI